MSVSGLATTLVNVYSVSTSKDSYGANYESYSLKYKAIPARFRYLKGRETFINGKEMTNSNYRIYIPYQLDIICSDLIIDIHRNRKYDILYVNKLSRKSHMQVDTNWVDNIIGDFCPNTVYQIWADILVGSQAFTFSNYSTVEIDSSSTKNHFIPLYTGSTTGYESSDIKFFGDADTNKVHTAWQPLIINGEKYYVPIYSGSATTNCCTDMISK